MNKLKDEIELKRLHNNMQQYAKMTKQINEKQLQLIKQLSKENDLLKGTIAMIRNSCLAAENKIKNLE